MLNGAATYSAVSDRIPEPIMRAATTARQACRHKLGRPNHGRDHFTATGQAGTGGYADEAPSMAISAPVM
jgi:hypothetical protein